MPNRIAASALPTSAPRPTFRPVSKAKAAPVKDNSLDPWTANDIWRMTMNGPINPATSANSAAAINACWTKLRPSRSAVTSKANRCARRSLSRSFMGVPARVAGMIDVFADDHVAAVHFHHLDVGAVERRERVGRHHLVDGADAEPPVDQVQHSIHKGQNRIDLMG